MSDLSFEEMLEDSLVTIHNGEVVEGTVIEVKDNEIILNIGYKADGILTKNEYSSNPDVDLTKEVKIDDKLTVPSTIALLWIVTDVPSNSSNNSPKFLSSDMPLEPPE